MLFRELVDTYERLEATSSRLEMTEILAEAFRRFDPAEIRMAVYLTQGQLYPDFVPLKLGMADKLALKAIAFASGAGEPLVQELMRKEGDPGLVAYIVFQSKKQTTLFSEPLTLKRAYETLEAIARAEGGGSQEHKVKLLAKLLSDASPSEAKFLSRVITGRMRLGVSTMTIVDALAVAFASKEDRDAVERAFNVSSDLGLVAETLALHGLEGVKGIRVQVNRPLRAMLAERMSSPEEILERMGGRCAFEYKYDGVRLQAHICDGEVRLFSRKLDELTAQFPDVVAGLKRAVHARSAIVEGECVPVDTNTGEFLPFQEVSHRRGRKYGVHEAVEDYPVKLFLFDCILKDGEDLTDKPFLERRAALTSIVVPDETVALSEIRLLSSPAEVQAFFQEAIRDGCEGLMAKSVAENSVYRAGNRGFLWIKYKKEYRSEMTDTVDLVVVGAFAGRGKRRGLYGALLMATYDPATDTFQTVSKLGSGFDDAALAALPEMLANDRLAARHHLVDSKMEADFWFQPRLVLEVRGAEITLSPIHTCCFGAIRPDAGLAIRFPRFTGRFREDKEGRDATTSQEILAMYQAQLKRVE
ncbi:MAG TPA: ATP-dependent DNA ligase [Methanomassiliicoccales archaeon]|nr:ATP-dependent DNA ligase [Methanomassiliicoccales archaeon]HQM67461.1 ATP-dependent DNA ligase [Methanomassiliicoccales archaeon]